MALSALSTNVLHGEHGNLLREAFSSRSFATVERRLTPANFSALVFVLHLAYIVLEPPSRARLILGDFH
jgi:hypothetical protein